MDEFCGSKFWDLNLTWHSDEPQLTECFEKTVLSWIPAIFLVIFGPLDIMIYSHNKCPKTTQAKASTVLSTARFSLCVILGLIQIIQLWDALSYKYGNAMNPPPADVVGPLVKFFTFMAALALAFVVKLRGVPSSGVQLALWFVVAICEFFPFLRKIKREGREDIHHHSLIFLLSYSYFPLVIIQFLLFCWADNPADKELHKNGSKVWPDGPFQISPCPEKQSSALNRLLFSWVDSLIWRGFRKPLAESDLWDLDDENKADVIARKFEAHWEAEANKNRDFSGNLAGDVGVVKVLIKTFGHYFLIGAGITVVPGLLDVAAPQIASMLLGFISSSTEEQWKGYMYACLLFLASMIAVLVRGQYAHIMYTTGFRVKSALMSAVYKKALGISRSSKQDASVGEIVNLMTVDVQKVVQVISAISTTWDCPIQIAVAFYLLWNTIGPSSLAGMSVIILLIPINIFLGNFARAYQVSQMKHKDERVKLITEVIRGLKVIKFQAWEKSFEDKVERIRNDEVNSLRCFAALGALNESMWLGSQCFVVLATFITYVLSNEDKVLDGQTIFVTLALINAITVPLTFLPRAIILCLQATVSLGRLNRFLNAKEVGGLDVEHGETAENAISLSSCNFGWSRKPSTEADKNVDLRIPEGALVAVVGPVGSGKSSLLAAMLGELENYRGRVNMNGSISYVAQEAWVQQGTIRNNILFGKPYDSLKYKAVLEACCLLKDFEILPQRDETLVEERGMNLSGGQRQRVSLARALYNDADIYLLDDPLSAVDQEVGQKIFDNIIGPNGLLRRKTRVLVTHNVRFLPVVDKIVVLNNGQVSQVGTYSELHKEEMISELGELNGIGAFSKYLLEFAGNSLQDDLADRKMKRPVESTFICKQRAASVVSSNSKSNRDGNKESFETTSVAWSTYLHYFRAGSFKLMLPSILMYFVYQGFAVGANVSLTAWATEPIVNGTQGHQGFYLGIYATLGGLQALALLAATSLVTTGSLRASSVLHNRLLKRIVRAPMWFFDITPTGRLICRFAKDVDVLDTVMVSDLRMLSVGLVSILATFATIVYTFPMFIVVFIPAAGAFIFMQKLYLPTSVQLRRLESVTQAPLYSYFGESILGITTIRAFGQQKRFFREALRRIDRHQRCYYLTLSANRWLLTRLGTVASIARFSAALFAVKERGSLSPGLAGLCITYAINVTTCLGQLVRSCCEMETDIVSVERIMEYCHAPQENFLNILCSLLPSWPSSGCISFSNYKANYREGLDLVLKGVNCTIQPEEKIGVVGRTGAGKSSLVLALFRMMEPLCGKILIDGQDISKVGLTELRSRLAIIPQDPVLFCGTLRFNLDPFEKLPDDAVWGALGLASLRNLVSNLPGQLNYEISEGGASFSVGQKQLVCLARALLRKSKILVLDEATASVDLETESLIQETIKKEFNDCTVITIAHRLKTVMNCDRVMVVDGGRILEFDSPETLLQVHNSRFYAMAKDSGLVEH